MQKRLCGCWHWEVNFIFHFNRSNRVFIHTYKYNTSIYTSWIHILLSCHPENINLLEHEHEIQFTNSLSEIVSKSLVLLYNWFVICFFIHIINRIRHQLAQINNRKQWWMEVVSTHFSWRNELCVAQRQGVAGAGVLCWSAWRYGIRVQS